MTNQRVCANTPALPAIAQASKESDADLSTIEGRVEWFCAHFEVEPPKLEYDQDEPDQILLTEEFANWLHTEGVSVDWVVSGHVAGALGVHRQRYRMTPDREEFLDCMNKFEPPVRAGFHALLHSVVIDGVPLEDAHAEFLKVTEEFRDSIRV